MLLQLGQRLIAKEVSMEQVFITVADINEAVITAEPTYVGAHVNHGKEVQQTCILRASVYTRHCGQEDIILTAYGKLADICTRECSIGTKVCAITRPTDNSNTKFIIDNIVIEKMSGQVVIDALLVGVSSSIIKASQAPPIGSISIRLVPVVKKEK